MKQLEETVAKRLAALAGGEGDAQATRKPSRAAKKK